MRILITAGPTREYLDDVRFLSNPSTGKMGFAIAESARRAGHDVVLVLGPVTSKSPKVEKIVHVTSAAEMFDAVSKEFDACDCFISAAAVCDWRPKERVCGKIKKTSKPRSLELVPSADILAQMGRRKKGQILVGFALETKDLREQGQEKLAKKKLDLIVVNTPAAVGEDVASVLILDAAGGDEELKNLPKAKIAKRLMERIEELAHRQGKR